MEDKAHAKAAVELVGAAERRLKNAWEHLYSGEYNKEFLDKIVHCVVELDAVRISIKKEYKL